MATFEWQYYGGSVPSWTNIGGSTLVFSGSAGIAAGIVIGQFNSGTHIGFGDPGTDQCGASHVNNVKYVNDANMIVNDGASEAINDTNLAETECTLRLVFNDSSSPSISNARLFSFDPTGGSASGSVVPAVECEIYAFERGVTASSWTKINQDSIAFGGDNTGSRLNLGNKSASANHYWYVALAFSPETSGSKPNVDLGIALTYS